jgi:hypothetical protein
LDQPSAQTHEPQPSDAVWQPFTVTVHREDAPTRASDVASVLQSRGVIGAVVDGDVAALPGWVLVRVAVDDDEQVATAGADGVPRPGTDVPSLVAAISRHLRATVLIDAPTTLGPDGNPVFAVGPDGAATSPVEPELDESRVRSVQAWVGHGALGARALASGAKHPLTVHEHEGSVVAVGEGVFLEPEPPNRWSFGFPYVAMTRTGDVRTFAYVAGKGRKALRLDLSWAPPLHAVVPVSVAEGTPAHGLALWLRLARTGDGELPAHPDLGEGLARALVTAAGAEQGDRFLATVAELFGVPPAVAQAAETGAVADLGAGERVEPESTGTLIRAALRQELTQEPSGTDPFSRFRRRLIRRPGWQLSIGVFELVAAALVALSLVGAWSDMPGWLRATSCALLAIDGLVNTVLASRRLRRGRARA